MLHSTNYRSGSNCKQRQWKKIAFAGLFLGTGRFWGQWALTCGFSFFFVSFLFFFFLSSAKRKIARVELISIDQKIINVLKRKSTKVFALVVTFHWPTSLLIPRHNLTTETCVNLFLRFTSYKYENASLYQKYWHTMKDIIDWLKSTLIITYN